jgi:hypothetical protein
MRRQRHKGADRVAPDKASSALAFRVTLLRAPAEPTISLNEMRERVAKLIFGDDWIGGLTDEQYKLLGKYITPRKIIRTDGSTHRLDHIERCPAGLASELDRVIGRQAQSDSAVVSRYP